jgi:hypothetical protein
VILIIQARQQRFTLLPDAPPEDASAQVKLAYKLKTTLGKAIYSARKCTFEPVIGIIKEVMGFRQFSLRGVLAAAGEWCLVCLAFNLKRFHTLSGRNTGTMASFQVMRPPFPSLFCQRWNRRWSSLPEP